MNFSVHGHMMLQEMHNKLPQDTTTAAYGKAHIVELKAPFLVAEKDGAFPYKHAVQAPHQHETCLTTGWPHTHLCHPFHAFPQARPLAVRAFFFFSTWAETAEDCFHVLQALQWHSFCWTSIVQVVCESGLSSTLIVLLLT